MFGLGLRRLRETADERNGWSLEEVRTLWKSKKELGGLLAVYENCSRSGIKLHSYKLLAETNGEFYL